jgi:tRNA-dihydrouridine synthase
MRTSGVDAVLIGRGVLRNPFLFEQAAALWRGETYEFPKAERYLQLLETQRQLLAESFPARMAMVHSRKFLAWYTAGMPGCHAFRSKVFTIVEPDMLWEEARAFFLAAADQKDTHYLQQPFLMGGHG